MRGKQSVDLHGLVLKQSISGFGFGAALTSLRNIGCGAGKEIARHHTQPLAMASIAQPHKAKLLFRPIPRWLGWFGANGSRKARWTRLFAQKPLAVSHQRVEINVFDRLVLAVLAILATTTAGLAHVDPISRTVRGGAKTVRLNVGLQQKRPITIRLGPILWQTPLRQRQHFGSQIFDPHPTRNHKARVGYHRGQVILTRRMAPADPTLARLQIQRSRTEPQRSQIAMLKGYQVAHLRAAQRAVSEIMMGRYQLLPLPIERAILRGHQNQLQPAHLLERPFEFRRNVQLRLRKAWSAKAHPATRGWQIDQATPLQAQKRQSAARGFGLAVGSAPIEPVANPTRQIRPRPLGMIAHRHVYAFQSLARKNLPARYHAVVHPRTVCHKTFSVSSVGRYGT